MISALNFLGVLSKKFADISLIVRLLTYKEITADFLLAKRLAQTPQYQHLAEGFPDFHVT
jgi:hypothetical protein